jgi:hypothetical protein
VRAARCATGHQNGNLRKISYRLDALADWNVGTSVAALPGLRPRASPPLLGIKGILPFNTNARPVPRLMG